MYKAQGDARAAQMAFSAAAHQDPRNVPAISAMGGLLMEHGDYEHAAMWINRALDIDPEYLPAHTNLGDLYAAEGNFAAAENEWLYVLQRNKNDVFAMDSVGRMMASQEQWDQAIFWFNKALAVDPNFQPAKTHLINATRHKLEAATQATTRAATRPATTTTH
jgi:tetratricopeptide (TPR) repeat protein